MNGLILAQLHGDILVITVNNPPVNALSPGVPEGLVAAVRSANADAPVKAIVVIGGGKTYIAGADIKEFGKITSGERGGIALAPMLEEIEDSAKPVVMAIHGTALGGGLETAMAGHYRVASPAAQVGQPEVKLGIIPGAGGTQRLPRLAGTAKAMEMCAFGEPVGAREAHAAGIVDEVIEGDLLEGAITFARGVAGARRTRDLSEKLLSPADAEALGLAVKAAAAKRLRGQTAPLVAVDCVAAASRLRFAEGCEFERKAFERCLFDVQSKSMIHAFFGERTVSKIPGLPKSLEPLEVRQAAVIGAGTMGGGIAMVYANAGIPVLLKDVSQEALDRGMATIQRNYENSVQKGRISPSEASERLARIRPVLSYDGFGEADIVVEAVFENLELKKQTFAEIDSVARPDAILATNTSTLDVDDIAGATRRPDWVIGHHFFSPAPVMRLLEIVRGRATSDRVISASMDLARRLRKVGVLAGNCRGFIGNRMFGPYRGEAVMMVEQGATPEQVDQALYNWGMAMGPLAVGDLAGLDVGWRIRKEFRHQEIPGKRYPEAEDLLCEKGWFGQKTGQGWYRYDAQRNARSNPEALELTREMAQQKNIPQRSFTGDEIIERAVCALINEGARLLGEGIAIRSVDIDMVYLLGYGFPIWRGGPMYYADCIGLPRIIETIKRFGWEPAPLLAQLTSTSQGFTRWSAR